jgi:hypothetical protein
MTCQACYKHPKKRLHQSQKVDAATSNEMMDVLEI